MRSKFRVKPVPQRAGEWRPWFAWRPIRVPAGRMYVWVWWEYVDHRWQESGSYDPTTVYEYRLRADR